MKAFVYRSGHVFLGSSVPEGAVELADWDNESDLLAVLRWESQVLSTSDGEERMVAFIAGSDGGSERAVIANVKHVKVRIQNDLDRLQSHPRGRSLYTVGPIEKWSPESVEAFQ